MPINSQQGIRPSWPFIGLAMLLCVVTLAVVQSTPAAAAERLIGLSYDQARQLILSDGWSPRRGDGESADVEFGNGRIFWERGFTELQGASGTGAAHCRFEFTDALGQVLVVITTGEESETGEYHAKVSGVRIVQLEERKWSNGFTTLADLERRMRLNGFPDLVELKRVVVELAQAAENGDRSVLVNAIHYPFTTYDRGEPVKVYETPAAVLQDYAELFTEDVLVTLRRGHYEALFVRDMGADIGGGRVWLFPYGDNGDSVRIRAINPWTPER